MITSPASESRWVAVAACVMAIAAFGEPHAQQPPASAPAIFGAWTLNKDLSDKLPDRSQSSDSGNSGSRSGSGGGYGRGVGGGGRRRGMGGAGSGGGSGNPEDAQRVRDAIRDIMTPPDHITIVQADSLIVVTTQDGRTTRLSTDGKKVKDDNTGIERKTKWDNGKLVSEISGAGRAKITETYAIDADTHRLHVTLQTEGGRNNKPTTQNRFYDGDKSED